MRRLKNSLRVLVLATLASAFVIASPAIAGPSGGTTVIADLNGDGISDLTVLNDSNAKTYGYLFNGDLGVMPTGSGTIKKLPPAWTAIALCDVNGDLDNDLLIQNDANGTIFGYLLTGTEVGDSGVIKKIPAGWTYKSCADVNGDGNADIVIQNDTSDMIFTYLLDGLNVGNSGSIKKIPDGWAFLGLADLTADNINDILIQGDTNGKVFGYILENDSSNFPEVATSGNIKKLPGGYDVSGTGDVNGDGSSDLQIQNAAGVVYTYILSGLSVTNQGRIKKLPGGYDSLGFGDLTGNGVDDLIIENPQSLVVFGYTLTGTPPTVDTSGQIKKLNAGWDPLVFQYAVPGN